MNAHERLLERVRTALEMLFSDTDVSQKQTRVELEELRDWLDERISSLPEDGDE